MAMRVAAFARLERGDDFLQVLKQYGVDDVVISGKAQAEVLQRFPLAAGDRPGAHWELADLQRLRQRCEDAGLRLVALENPVPPWCYDRAMLGLPGRDQQIDNLAVTIRNMGRAGIGILGYHWMVNPPGRTQASWRTSTTTPGRGGALVSSFDGALAHGLPLFRDRDYTEAELWANYAYFVRALVPVVEAVGVRLALHPDDPPVERLGGMPRLFCSVTGFERAMDIAGSPASGLNLCLGNWTAMGTDMLAAIRHFGGRGQIVYGHVQGVQGTVPSFRECFLDEADCDLLTVLRTLNEVGFEGVLAPGHLPRTADGPDQHAGLAYAIGYVKGLLRALGR